MVAVLAQMSETISAAIDKKELLGMESGAIGYMLSKQGYLSDRDEHWHPLLMFFAPLTDPLMGRRIAKITDPWV